MGEFQELIRATAFRDKVNEELERHELSARSVAKEAGISPSYLSRIIHADRSLPSDEKILALAKALKMDHPEELLVEIGRIPYSPDILTTFMKLIIRTDKSHYDELFKYLVKMSYKKPKDKEDNKGQDNE